MSAIYGLFGKILGFFNDLTGNYIFAIALFALVVQILMLPLAVKQQKNSIKQAMLAPKVAAIRKKYAGRNDNATKQKLQQETMDLYTKEGFNPAGGCLPLLIQFPVIIILYNVVIKPLSYMAGFSAEVMTAVGEKLVSLGVYADTAAFDAARKASEIGLVSNIQEHIAELSSIEGFSADKIPSVKFGAIDLSLAPQEAIKVGDAWQWSWLILIPILSLAFMYATQFITRKFTYQPPEAKEQQKSMSMRIMNLSMPLFSAYLSFIWPSVLGIYWIIRNIYQIIQQVAIAKVMPAPQFTDEDYKAAEREYAGKAVRKVQKSENAGKVRSLHHIDDDDDGETESTVKNTPKKAEGAQNLGEAPKLKDESDR